MSRDPGDGLGNKNWIMSPILWGELHVHLKMSRGSGFPRLVRFQKWLGFMILDVNSCSNLTLTGQEQCQGWPSEHRWQQVTLTRNLLGKQIPTKRLSHNHTLLFCLLSAFCSVLQLCYHKAFHFKVISGDRHSIAVFTLALSLIYPPESLMKASETVSQVGETK